MTKEELKPIDVSKYTITENGNVIKDELKQEAKDIQIKELQEQKCHWKESSFDWRHKFFKKDEVKLLIKKDKQLAKAKELLSKLLKEENDNMFWEMNGSDKSSYYKVRKQAEQFLSEVENDVFGRKS